MSSLLGDKVDWARLMRVLNAVMGRHRRFLERRLLWVWQRCVWDIGRSVFHKIQARSLDRTQAV